MWEAGKGGKVVGNADGRSTERRGGGEVLQLELTAVALAETIRYFKPSK